MGQEVRELGQLFRNPSAICFVGRLNSLSYLAASVFIGHLLPNWFNTRNYPFTRLLSVYVGADLDPNAPPIPPQPPVKGLSSYDIPYNSDTVDGTGE